jgi:hypothetical protein
VSTTRYAIRPDVLSNSGFWQGEIYIKKGSEGVASIARLSAYSDEFETLLQKGAQFRKIGEREVSGYYNPELLFNKGRGLEGSDTKVTFKFIMLELL